MFEPSPSSFDPDRCLPDRTLATALVATVVPESTRFSYPTVDALNLFTRKKKSSGGWSGDQVESGLELYLS